MKNVILSISVIIVCGISIAQNSVTDYWSWDKIIINDFKGGWTSWNNEFQLERSTLNLILVGDRDSVIGKIDSTLIIDLFNSFDSPINMKEDPLLMFGKDSTWLIDNSIELWLEYLGDRNEKASVDSIAVTKLKNYHSYKNVILNMEGLHWTDDYPYMQLQIIKNLDTAIYISMGQFPFMLPWIGDTGAIYNSSLPETIGKMLPNSNNSNKSRLTGVYFNHRLIDEIYINFIEKEVEIERVKNKYKVGFRRLSKHFQIESAEVCMMGSIEWGGFVASNCLELYLSDSSNSENIQFSTVFGRRILPHPIGSIIRKKKKLLNQLKDNLVYTYCIQNDSCLGEIHFVNHKSLSWEAKRNFLSDVKDQHQGKGLYRGRLRKAIFFELTEFKNGKESFSRWIFLKDGTVVLWQLKGDYLMNFSNSNSLKYGYICKEIELQELKNMTDNK